MVTFSKAERKL